jgi:hypothetical protein
MSNSRQDSHEHSRCGREQRRVPEAARQLEQPSQTIPRQKPCRRRMSFVISMSAFGKGCRAGGTLLAGTGHWGYRQAAARVRFMDSHDERRLPGARLHRQSAHGADRPLLPAPRLTTAHASGRTGCNDSLSLAACRLPLAARRSRTRATPIHLSRFRSNES